MTLGLRVTEFDTWRPLYGGSAVSILRAGTTDLLDVFLDPELTQLTGNPQTLSILTQDNVQYGKFAQPVYVGESYFLSIDDTDQTGVTQKPLTTLVGEDASEAVVSTRRSARERQFQDILDNAIYALDYGEIGESTSTNTATLNAAIGAAAAQGGGIVFLPAANIPFIAIFVPEGVVLSGEGPTATTLQSLHDEEVVTLSGDRAGLRNLTLDGLNLVPESVGLFAVARDWTVLDNVIVRRFDTNVRMEGARYGNWRDFSVENGNDGILLLGEGAPVEQNLWTGGSIRQHTGTALKLGFEDEDVRNNTFRRLLIDENVGDEAVHIVGARNTRLEQITWTDNINALRVEDGSDTSLADRNTVIELRIDDSLLDGGTYRFDGTCDLTAIRRSRIIGATLRMELPDNFILLEDCIETPDVVVTQNARQLVRNRTGSFMEVTGVTTDSTNIRAWEYLMQPGELLYLEAKVTANRRDGPARAFFHAARPFRRPPSQLSYGNQVSSFTVGAFLSGQTSGATARIQAVESNLLRIKQIIGDFLDGETITDDQGGQAQADGTPVLQDVEALDSVADINGPVKGPSTNADNYTINLNASGGKARVMISGDTGHTVEWNVRVEIFG